MKVSQLIKVLEQLDPNYDVFYVQTTGVVAPIKSVQEFSYRGFHPEAFVGLCCGKEVNSVDLNTSPVYISVTRK